ncbi:unnamed protein product [Dibothriocephalus latus]|uniref:Uncharacterized protein n=1 Tax=Dibothriocephalus latus TaxID=60516 RepID=A0A3P6TP74_DIBLA|nr:unnamed protein product [Dibothriocephalus latus]
MVNWATLLSEKTVTISPNTAALEQLARRYHPEEGSEEPFEISAKLSKYISQRKKGFALRNAKQDLMKAIIPTTTGKSDVADVDKAAAADECAEVFEDEADRVVKDEDAIRLRKFAREVTKKAVMEKMREKVRNKMSTITQIRGTLRESGPSGSEGEDDLDSDLQILEPVTLLTREEMESLLQPMRKKLGDDHETCLLITNALNHDEDGVRKFCKFVSDGRLRESFLATIVSVEWVFYFLAAVNGSARTLMGLLDTLADKSEANRTNAQAVVKLLTGQLGEGPYLKPFYNAFMQCRAAVVSFCVKRGGNQAEIEAVFRECLCDMDDEYERMGEMLGLTDEEFAVGEDRRIANMDVDDDDFSGPEGTNEVEVRVYNRMGSTSPGQSGVFTDGAGLELPDFIDEQSEDISVESCAKTFSELMRYDAVQTAYQLNSDNLFWPQTTGNKAKRAFVICIVP